MAKGPALRRLNVWMNGELVGHWQVDSAKGHQFYYAESWLESDLARPLSLSMPLQNSDQPHSRQVVEYFFENLLPDSADIRRRLQSRFGTNSDNAFELLSEIGRDCVGAIQLLPVEQTPNDLDQIQCAPLNESDIAAVLRSTSGRGAPGLVDDQPFRISIAGAQEKTALLWNDGRWNLPEGSTPTTHIFKLPLGRVGNMQADLSTSVENEWLCAQLVKAFGVPVANCEIGQFEDQKVLIVERFDRLRASEDGRWLRRPQEDMCQALGYPPGEKYEADGGPGIAEIADLLLGSTNAQADREVFLKTLIFYWMLCAPDGHAKNFSVFLRRQGRFALTPVYDVLSAFPVLGNGAEQIAPKKVRLAMAATGENKHYRWAEILPRHWVSTAKAIGLVSAAERMLGELPKIARDAVEEVGGSLPDGFPVKVSEPIFNGVLEAAGLLERSGWQ